MKRGNETVNRIIDGLKYWAFPKTNAEAAREIDMLNIVNIHYTSTVLCAVQTISLLDEIAAGEAQKISAARRA